MVQDLWHRTTAFSLRSPVIHRMYVRSFYELYSRFVKGDVQFMNYGYADPEGVAPISLKPEDEPNRYQIQMYHHVASQIDLRGLEVLEIGSGRGGGAAYIFNRFGPKRMVGLDISAQAIEFCNRRHALPGLRFLQGDAESLTWPAQSFDAALNIESAHHYGNIGRFFSEVERVLRPGGSLLFADCWASKAIEPLMEQFRTAGLELRQRENITPGVMRALELDDARKVEAIERRAPRFVQRRLKEWSNTKDSKNYAGYRTGEMQFICCLLRKS
jgi:ubiquinone/menaquinone biosynthesis C-methylase UbiE